ncbi:MULTISPECIES: hypothetical protein [Achromobacter]|uniref:Uncharacterized protein n=2 Tax=Achromobacter piechaudii TaxID=72556 RepID=A0A6S7DYW5_9BURK|nr:hypothetical protein [Achromobacter piechaudii]EFF75134.1 hypothetical protein HMPREF0004_3466 [Achromobacter piechaudii ATCC 43553]CAB3685293.1 hypothetical protein LMG1873_01815 [Achromobacter piechaudii]CAB3867496.1 hypothetical protein LMG2828_02805 [Achromobacter piechaudii]CAB3869647.1 hypothetical protein LMG1861_02694 [Achromobacter piechaudii]CAB3948568.1 hypothetical protein LMG6103_01935 [Achromobacter piechaudii]
MSHQLVGKKWRFEVPPLNWTAPDANKESEIDAVDADSETSEDSDTSRSSK